MARIGLEYIVAAPIDESGNEPTWSGGMVIAKAITANLTFDKQEASLFADNMQVEYVSETTGGTINFNGDDISFSAHEFLFGNTLETNEDGVEVLKISSTDNSTFNGLGFIGKILKNNVIKYGATWVHKTKFGIPNEDFETQGENLTFQTPTVEGKFMDDKNGVLLVKAIFDTVRAAKTWLNTKAGIE